MELPILKKENTDLLLNRGETILFINLTVYSERIKKHTCPGAQNCTKSISLQNNFTAR